MLCKVTGPTRDRNRWRLRIVDLLTEHQSSRFYASEEEAKAAKPKLVREYRRAVGVPFPAALKLYREHLETVGNMESRGPNRPRTMETTMQRMTAVFSSSQVTGELTQEGMTSLWARMLGSRRAGKPLAVDTALNIRAQTKTFLKWLDSQGMLKTHPDELMKKILVKGGRKKGKPKLTQDEVTKLMEWSYAQPQEDEGAVATVMAFLLNMRASEIANRIVRDLDAKGTKLRITNAKTDAGNRRQLLPSKIAAMLQALAKGKRPEDRLLGQAINRHWVLRQVKRCCKAAGVVTPHGLRGTHAEVGMDVGISAVLLAQSMGHENTHTTIDHYAGRGAAAQAGINRVIDEMN